MKKLLLAFVLSAFTIFALGCTTDTSTSGTVDTKYSEDKHDDHAGHDHGASDHKPPRGGHLIELGPNHEYHAELVDDHETETITVYMMDGDMKPLAIKQESISLILTSDSETKTFELKAGTSDGSSEFSSNDEDMMTMIDQEGVKGKLRVTIDGTPFNGTFDHVGHDH